MVNEAKRLKEGVEGMFTKYNYITMRCVDTLSQFFDQLWSELRIAVGGAWLPTPAIERNQLSFATIPHSN